MLRIPKIRLEVPVLPGTDDRTLDRAVGHIEGTAKPGTDGNLGIAGHRDGFFRGLKDVAPGDAMELDTFQGKDTYRVERTWVVNPEDVSVLDPTSTRTLTLVTCFPFYYVGSAPRRFIVRAVLAPAKRRPRRPQMNASRVPCAETGGFSRCLDLVAFRKWSRRPSEMESVMSRLMSQRGPGRVAVLVDRRRGAGADNNDFVGDEELQVLAVDGNKLDVRLPEGTKELNVPDDFRFTVNGQQLSVHQLKVGMKGTATITTRTTLIPVTVTEIKNGTVVVRLGRGHHRTNRRGRQKLLAIRRGQARREDVKRRQVRGTGGTSAGRSAERDHHYVQAAEDPDREASERNHRGERRRCFRKGPGGSELHVIVIALVDICEP